MAKRKAKNVYFIKEPDWKQLSLADTEEKRDQAFRDAEFFVHYEINDKKLAEATRIWIEKHSGWDRDLIKKLKRVKDVWLSSFGKPCYKFLKLGFMPERTREHLENKLPTLESKAEEVIEKLEEKKTAKPVMSIQDRMREQVTDLCAKWENSVDELISGEFNFSKFDPYNDMRAFAGGVVKPAHAKIIKDDFLFQLEEAKEVVQWEDPDIKEAYSFMDVKMRKQYLAFFEKIDTACDTFIETGKAKRKPRKPKAVSKEKLVSKLKYQINDSDLGIASINPIEILDATELWVYNTKNRKLGVYKVEGLKPALNVKGTSITDFNATSSIQKTLRKPAEQLKEFKGTAKTKFQKAFDNIKAVEIKMNGRINNTTIILKAF